jgi:hypothetical protein
MAQRCYQCAAVRAIEQIHRGERKPRGVNIRVTEQERVSHKGKVRI